MCCSANGSMRWRSRAWRPARPRCFWSTGARTADAAGFSKTKASGLSPGSSCVAQGAGLDQRFDFLAFFFFLATFLAAFFAVFLAVFLADFFAADFLAAFLAFLAFFGAAFFAAFFTAFLAAFFFLTAGLAATIGGAAAMAASVVGSTAVSYTHLRAHETRHDLV